MPGVAAHSLDGDAGFLFSPFAVASGRRFSAGPVSGILQVLNLRIEL